MREMMRDEGIHNQFLRKFSRANSSNTKFFLTNFFKLELEKSGLDEPKFELEQSKSHIYNHEFDNHEPEYRRCRGNEY